MPNFMSHQIPIPISLRYRYINTKCHPYSLRSHSSAQGISPEMSRLNAFCLSPRFLASSRRAGHSNCNQHRRLFRPPQSFLLTSTSTSRRGGGGVPNPSSHVQVPVSLRCSMPWQNPADDGCVGVGFGRCGGKTNFSTCPGDVSFLFSFFGPVRVCVDDIYSRMQNVQLC